MPPALKKFIILIGVPTADQPVFGGALSEWDLHFFPSGTPALELIKQGECPELIFVDTPEGLDPLELIQTINGASESGFPTILVLKEGDEKTAVAAVQQGVSDYLTRGEIIPPIIRMTATRAIEHKKWERIYLTLAGSNEAASLKDPQTQLYNKWYFETRLTEEVKRSERYNFPLTMILFYIEQFEFITQKYGEELAEALLKEFGGVLLRDLRSSDLLARMGKERFAMLLPHTSVNQALLAWNRFLQTVSQHPFSLKRDNFYISMKGVLTPLNREVETIDALVAKLEVCIRENSSSEEPLFLYLEN